MKYRHAAAQPLENPEVVINLWAYSGEDGTILRLAGKTYVMQGTDAEKLALLRRLAATDFLSASWHKVPANFTIQHTDFGEMKGAAHASMINEQHYHERLFGPLIEKLAQSIPEQARSVNGEYQKFRLELPEAPLCISTIVMEYEDGTLAPMVSA
ncbi:hypothetical protein EBAPG3_005115 [Nitrosospira lacus]|uniref:Uncharacterized protein n=1 Tax=Nitrosospira lacus TaxID=1288494 RepID=A0A1W6SMZ7_9PROT|nr:hypothetical protein [Nitrosospira lacus]ARO87199.1 hypothetical protein EBAPG3_005115 [Nitrosospira lacus]